MPWRKPSEKRAGGESSGASDSVSSTRRASLADAAASRGMSEAELHDFLSWWVQWMDARLAHFRDFELQGECKLDWTYDSLTHLADVLLRRYPEGSCPDFVGDKDFLEGVMRYIGEMHRRAYGGNWDIGKDPDLIDFGEVLVEFEAPIPSLVPRIQVTSMIFRRNSEDWALVFRAGRAWLDDARVERVSKGLPSDDPNRGLPADSRSSKASPPSHPIEPPARLSSTSTIAGPDHSQRPDSFDGAAFLSWWITSMPSALQQLRNALPPTVSQELDGSLESLRRLGEILLELFEDEQAFLDSWRNGDPIAEGAVRYLGEVLNKHAEAEWIFHPGARDDKNANTGRPLVVSTKEEFARSPEEVWGLLIAERDPSLLEPLIGQLS